MDYSYIITQSIIDKCTQFAKDSAGTSLNVYARRQQTNVEKIIQDIRNGKIGEECTYRKLNQILPDISSPDYNIYEKKSKSWDPDLKDPSGIKVAIKSQNIESAINYGVSWVFQYNNGGDYDCDKEIFKIIDPNQYVAFNSLNVPKKIGEIKAIVKVQWLHDKGLFKPMKLKYLQGNKVAVYFDDLLNYKEELFQLQ